MAQDKVFQSITLPIDVNGTKVPTKYVLPPVDDTLTQQGAAADAKKTGDEITDLKEALTDVSATLTHKADKDGTVASAEQLLSDVGTEDKAPYLFRATPYDSTRVDEEVVGVSVGWNQFYVKGHSQTPGEYGGVTITVNDDGSLTLNGTCSGNAAFTVHSGITHTDGHKYLVSGWRQVGSNTGYLGIGGTKVDGGDGGIINGTSSTWNLRIDVRSGDVYTNTKIYPQFIDLTAWFGSTIADYAYTLETATAGSGVAWIKQFLPGGYIPYSAPGLASVSGLSGHKFVGFNQFAVAPAYRVTSEVLDKSKAVRMLPGVEYQFTFDSIRTATNWRINVKVWDMDGNFIKTSPRPFSVDEGGPTYNSNTHGWVDGADNTIKTRVYTFNTPCYALFEFSNGNTASGMVMKDACLHLVGDGSRNGQYEPYKETTYALDSDLTLRGILRMDSNHRVYADGDVHKADGTVTRRYGVHVFDGSESFIKLATETTGWNVFAYNPSPATTNDTIVDFTTDAGKAVKYADYDASNITEPLVMHYGNGMRFILNASDVATAKTMLTGKTLVYLLATPTTETADPYASPQNCAVGGTEEYVYAEGGSGVPVGHNSKYLKNMRSELERVSVAVPEVGSTAGTYTLKATVTAQGVTYAWVAE